MKHTLDLETIAEEIKTTQDQARQIAPLTSRINGLDEATAYEVAQRVHQMRLNEGAVAIGRKIGFTNPEMWSLYGVHEPIWGYVYDKTVVHLETSHTTCHIGNFVEPKIEPEIVIHFRSVPPVSASTAEILACIDWIAHGFEIVQSHFPGWRFKAADAIADSGLHGTLLIGKRFAIDQLDADIATMLERFTITLACNGKERAAGRGSNVLGSPLTAISNLLTVISKQPPAMQLQANELVTTGTLTAALPVCAGETWHTELSGIALPGLSVRFVI